MKYSRAEEKRKLKEKCIKEIVETKITRKKKTPNAIKHSNLKEKNAEMYPIVSPKNQK